MTDTDAQIKEGKDNPHKRIGRPMDERECIDCKINNIAVQLFGYHCRCHTVEKDGYMHTQHANWCGNTLSSMHLADSPPM